MSDMDQVLNTVYRVSTAIVIASLPLLLILQTKAKTREESQRAKTMLLMMFAGYVIIWLMVNLIRQSF